jgi:hypothetical protein
MSLIPATVAATTRQIIDAQPEAIRRHVEMDIVMLSHTIGGMCRHPYMSSDWFVHNAMFGETANRLALKLSEQANFEASRPVIEAIRAAYADEGMRIKSE